MLNEINPSFFVNELFFFVCCNKANRTTFRIIAVRRIFIGSFRLILDKIYKLILREVRLENFIHLLNLNASIFHLTLLKRIPLTFNHNIFLNNIKLYKQFYFIYNWSFVFQQISLYYCSFGFLFLWICKLLINKF